MRRSSHNGPSEPQLHYKAPNPNTLRLTRTNQVEDDFDEAETGGPAAAPPEVKPEAGAEAALRVAFMGPSTSP